MPQKSQIKPGIIISYLNFLVTAVMGLLYVPYLIRILPENEYGLYLLMYSFMSMISVLDLGMTGTITRYYSKYDYQNDIDGKNKVISISKKIYGVLSICIFFAGGVIFLLFGAIYSKSLTIAEMQEAQLILVLIVVNAVILIQSNIYIALIQAKEKFFFQRSILLIRTLIIPITAIVLSFVFRKALVIFATHLGCNICFYICYRLYVQRNICLDRTKSWDSHLFQELLSYAFFLFLNTIVDELYWNTDSMILGAIGGASAVAVYGTASTIVTQFRGFSSVIHGIFLPRLTKMATGENRGEEINKLFLDVSKIQFVIVFIIYSGFLVYGREFVILWAGEGYAEAYNLAIITMTALVVPLTQSIGISILRAYNKQKFRAVLYIVLAILNVSLSIPAAYKWGGYGCAAVTAVFLLVGNTVIMNIYYQREIHLNMKNWWAQFGRLIIPVAVVACIGFSVKNVYMIDSLHRLIISILAYSIFYCVAIFIIGIDKSDRNRIIEAVPFWRKNT